MTTVGVLGLGKLGLPLLVSICEVGYQVVGYDKNEDLIDSLANERFDSPEPGLHPLLARNRQHIKYTSMAEDLRKVSIVYIIVPTPSESSGEFSNHYVFEAISDILSIWKTEDSPKTLVIVSTVMPGTCRLIVEQMISKHEAKSSVSVIYSPEFIALGSVLFNLANPDMVLVGCDRPDDTSLHLEIQRKISGDRPTFIMSFEEAELAKLLVNAFVTMKISFANSFAEMAEGLGIENAETIAEAIGSDSRIGQRYLRPGFGFGGPCFPRDNRALRALCGSMSLSAEIASAVDAVNSRQVKRIIDKILRMYPLAKSVGVFGLTYKPNSTVTEESQSIDLAYALMSQGIKVKVYDPLLREAENLPGLVFAQDIKEFSLCDLVVIPHSFYIEYKYSVTGSKIMVI